MFSLVTASRVEKLLKVCLQQRQKQAQCLKSVQTELTQQEDSASEHSAIMCTEENCTQKQSVEQHTQLSENQTMSEQELQSEHVEENSESENVVTLSQQSLIETVDLLQHKQSLSYRIF